MREKYFQVLFGFSCFQGFYCFLLFSQAEQLFFNQSAASSSEDKVTVAGLLCLLNVQRNYFPDLSRVSQTKGQTLPLFTLLPLLSRM